MNKIAMCFIALVLVIGFVACGSETTPPPEAYQPLEEIEEAVAVQVPVSTPVSQEVEDPEPEAAEDLLVEPEEQAAPPPDVVEPAPKQPVVSPPVEQELLLELPDDTTAAIQTERGLMSDFVLSHYFPAAGIDWRVPINDMSDASLLAVYINDIVVAVPGPDEFFAPFMGGPTLELSFTLDGVPQTYGIWWSDGGHEWFPPGRVAAYRIGNPPDTILAVDERIWDVLNRYDQGR